MALKKPENRTGPFHTYSEAEQLADSINEAGADKAIIVRDRLWWVSVHKAKEAKGATE